MLYTEAIRDDCASRCSVHDVETEFRRKTVVTGAERVRRRTPSAVLESSGKKA